MKIGMTDWTMDMWRAIAGAFMMAILRIQIALTLVTAFIRPPIVAALLGIQSLARGFGEMCDHLAARTAEHKRAEEALRASEERTRLIVDTALDAVVTMDAGGRITGWNARAEATFGWPREEAIGRTLSDTIIPPRLREAHQRGLARFLAGGQGQVLNRRVETTGLHRDGHEFPVELAITPLSIGGRPAFSAFLRDITERKQTERRLEVQYAATRVLAEADSLATATPRLLQAVCERLGWEWAALWDVDSCADVLRCTATWHAPSSALAAFEDRTRARTFELGVGLPGRAWAAGEPIWLPDLAAAGPDVVRATRAVEAGLRAALGVPIQGSRKIVGIVEFFSAEARQPDPELLEAIVAIGRQLGQFVERKRAEEEIRALEEQNSRLVDNASDSIITYDLSGRLTFVNRRFCEVTGYSPDAAKRLHARDLIHPDDRALVDENVRRRLAGEEIPPYGFRALAKGGRTLYVEPNASVIRDRAGRPVGVQAIIRDVTERREAEEMLRATERQALQAEKLRALGQMASGVAHDLNQALGLVVGHTELAMRALERPTARPIEPEAALETVMRAATDGAETVKRLLTFARSYPEGDAEQVDIGALFQEVAQLTAPRWRGVAQAEGRPISLDVEAQDGLIVEGWPASLREALTNLIFNAVDALPLGGTIRLLARRADDRIQIDVADTGIGMSPDVQARIFEPFYTTKGERGTGLGLSMVFGVVERHRGEVSVTSESGRGTTFRLTLPAVASRPAERAVRPAEATTGRPLRILAVDDEPALARMAALILAQHGHTVLVANSGEEALERLAAEAIDFVFSDVAMGPGINGWELADQVRQRWPHVRFALATGWGAGIDPSEAQARGVEAVIAKPYRLDDLQRVLTDGMLSAES